MTPENKEKYIRIIVLTYGLLLLAINVVRLPLDDFWADEAFTGLMANRTFARIIANTAMDVHPPLYYFITKIAVIILGDRPWVFRLVSFIPYLCMIVWGLTTVIKRWGYTTSAIFITLISITSEALLYNTQVRMYSWTAFLLLMTFDRACRVIKEDKIKDYILLTVYSVCTSYTHYYGLLPTFFTYFGLLIVYLLKRRKIRGILLSGLSVAVLYIPWLIVLLRTMSRLSSDGYWITRPPSVRECIKYFIPLNNKYMQYVALVFVVCIVLRYLYEYYISRRNFEDCNRPIYLIGIISVIATIIIGELISLFILPVFIERYMYPIAVIFWLLVSLLTGYYLEHKQNERIIAWAVVTFIVAGNVGNYKELAKSVRDNTVFIDTKAVIDDSIGDSEIITDDNTTVFYWYYHDNECNKLGEDGVILDKSRYVAVLTDTSEADLAEEMREYSITEVFKDGVFGAKNVNVYILNKRV